MNDNEIIKVTETVMRQLKELEFKTNQINKVKSMVNEGRKEFLEDSDHKMSYQEKLEFLSKMEQDLDHLETLVKDQSVKIQNICTQCNLDAAFQTATVLNKWFN